MSKKLNQDHLKLDVIDDTHHYFLCTVCNEGERMTLPVGLNQWLEGARNFIKKHKRCASKPNERKQSKPTSM